MATSNVPSDTTNLEYDYIVVGGGTSGPVAARRLAEGEPNARVLLVEAGPSNESIVNSHMAMGWQNLHKTEHDWGYDTEPQVHANNRVISIPRGKFLGGCSGLNGMLILRGARDDYDQWAEMGNEGWAWKDVLPLFKKSETFHPIEGFEADLDAHGFDGPLHTTVHPLAPISEGLLESYVDKGFPYKPDMFVQGEGSGVGHSVRTVYKGVRTTAADFVHNNPPSNLDLLLNTTALRIILEPLPDSDSSSPKYRAVGVEAEDSTTRKPVTLRAKKEIILSAGAYNSPFILMHSGVGPKEHLKEHGLKCKVDLKGVGSNLMDHLIVFSFYACNSNLTYDHLIYPPGAIDSSVKEWLDNKSGVMSRFPFGAFAFTRLDEQLKNDPEWKAAKEKNPGADPMGQSPGQPHVEYFSTELYGGGPQHPHLPKLPTDSAFAMITMLCGPHSRGTVRLASGSPHDKPKIDHHYLENPLDVSVLAAGTKLAHEVALEGAGTKDHISGAWPVGRVTPDDSQGWKEYVRQQAGTCYHPGGTCKMAPESDPEGVVDPRLRVRGVVGLRVADISIMPKLNNGHTQAPAYMIGEKVAQLVLEDNRIKA